MAPIDSVRRRRRRCLPACISISLKTKCITSIKRIYHRHSAGRKLPPEQKHLQLVAQLRAYLCRHRCMLMILPPPPSPLPVLLLTSLPNNSSWLHNVKQLNGCRWKIDYILVVAWTFSMHAKLRPFVTLNWVSFRFPHFRNWLVHTPATQWLGLCLCRAHWNGYLTSSTSSSSTVHGFSITPFWVS